MRLAVRDSASSSDDGDNGQKSKARCHEIVPEFDGEEVAQRDHRIAFEEACEVLDRLRENKNLIHPRDVDKLFNRLYLGCDKNLRDIDRICRDVEESQWLHGIGDTCQQEILNTKYLVTQCLQAGSDRLPDATRKLVITALNNSVHYFRLVMIYKLTMNWPNFNVKKYVLTFFFMKS